MPPKADEVNPTALRSLITELKADHGKKYARAAEHQARLAALTKAAAAGKDVTADLVTLQRQVLLFDVDKLLAIRRHEQRQQRIISHYLHVNRYPRALTHIFNPLRPVADRHIVGMHHLITGQQPVTFTGASGNQSFDHRRRPPWINTEIIEHSALFQ